MSAKKRNATIALAGALVVLLAIGGTLAYFFDQDAKTNRFTAASDGSTTGVNIELTETTWDPAAGVDVVPGDVITKNPTIKNLSGESYARVIVSLNDKATGAPITDQTRINKIKELIFFDGTGAITEDKYSSTELGALALPQFNADFVLDAGRGSDGVLFYNLSGILAPAQEVTLFTHVIIPTNWSQNDIALLGDFDIVVTGQAIQTANFATAADAFTALDAEVAAIPTP